MAQVIVRHLEDDVKVRLKRRAAQHGRSMEEEVRDILRGAVSREDVSAAGLGSEIAALFTTSGLDSEIPELRGHVIRPASFKR